MITHIIFDNNGVLTTSDEEVTYKKVSEFLRISIEEFKNLLKKYVRDLDCGKITQNEFYSFILKEGGLDFSLEEFRKVHLGCYVSKPEVQSLAANLNKRYKTFLMSNFGDVFWQMYDAWGLGRLFRKENVFVSSDIGMAKPDKEIFLYVLYKLNVLPQKVIFIDDNSNNINSAREIGFNAIYFTDLTGLKQSLKNFGVNF